jgi:hypothetical protein
MPVVDGGRPEHTMVGPSRPLKPVCPRHRSTQRAPPGQSAVDASGGLGEVTPTHSAYLCLLSALRVPPVGDPGPQWGTRLCALLCKWHSWRASAESIRGHFHR